MLVSTESLLHFDMTNFENINKPVLRRFLSLLRPLGWLLSYLATSLLFYIPQKMLSCFHQRANRKSPSVIEKSQAITGGQNIVSCKEIQRELLVSLVLKVLFQLLAQSTAGRSFLFWELSLACVIEEYNFLLLLFVHGNERRQTGKIWACYKPVASHFWLNLEQSL